MVQRWRALIELPLEPSSAKTSAGAFASFVVVASIDTWSAAGGQLYVFKQYDFSVVYIRLTRNEPLITCRQNRRHRCQSLNSGAHMLEYLAVVVNGSFGPLHSCWMYCHCSFVHWPTYLAATKLICGEIFYE